MELKMAELFPLFYPQDSPTFAAFLSKERIAHRWERKMAENIFNRA